MLLQWCTASRTPLALYPIYLFNQDFADTGRVLKMLLEREKEPPPYLWLVVLNVLHARLRLSHTELSHLVAGPFPKLARFVRRLFDDRKLWRDWLDSKPQPLRFYGGAALEPAGAAPVRRGRRGNAKSWRATRLGHVALSAHAIHRVVEIASAGKAVDLFTIQRATRPTRDPSRLQVQDVPPPVARRTPRDARGDRRSIDPDTVV